MRLGRRQFPMVEGLQPGERVLAQAEGTAGRIVATDWRLMWSDGSISWYEIERATWDGDDESLRVEPAPTSAHARTLRLPITNPGQLVDVVREQVVGSVVLSRRVAVAGRRGARVSGRRKPDGEMVWSVVLDAGVDPEDRETRQRLDEAVAAVRSEIE